MNILIYPMIYSGAALMVVNISRYVSFYRLIQREKGWEKERTFFLLPIILLVLFLIGYLTVAIFGKPDLVVASILFGGSIFVFAMILFVRRALARIQEHEQLKSRLSAAEEANKAKTFFLSNMSHDIRTPMNAIIGYTNLASQEGVTLQQKNEYIRKIDIAGKQLLDIVNDVLEMSRIESGKLILEPETIDLERAVCEVEDLIRTQMEHKGIHFLVHCELAHKWVLCDQPLLTRALMNLLGNALKFTPEGGTVSLSVEETKASQDSMQCQIRVKDTGIGMSQSFVDDLFVPFERERTSTVSKTQGTGLGMSITKGIVDLMGATITVDTKEGEGTEFLIQAAFPLGEALPQMETKQSTTLSLQGRRVLLVDDNPINVEIAQTILEQADLLVETAENGQLAVDKVKESSPGYFQAVLMDIQMPVMDGYTAARQIRALPDPALKSLPIIAMTANAFQEDIQRAEEAGMNAHVAKPINPDQLFKTLTAQLCEEEGALPLQEGEGALPLQEGKGAMNPPEGEQKPAS